MRWLLIGLAIAWLSLAGRLIQLQWLDQSRLSGLANRQRVYTEPMRSIPGEILDRHGRLLATTVSAKSLFLDPSKIRDVPQVAGKLGDLLSIDAGRLQARLRRYPSRKFLWVKRRLSDQEIEAVRQLNLPADAWGFREEPLRRYPQGRLAAHVLGLRDIDGHGRGGLEQRFDALLRGRDGQRRIVRDARGRAIHVLDQVTDPPRHGKTLVLSLDVVVQLYAERTLEKVMTEWKPRSACALVLDPGTGELLAMASRPDYDPNDPSDTPPAAWKNHCVTAQFEPGSTVKPFFMAWAVQHGLLDPNEEIFCENGEYRMGRRVLHDHHPYGSLSVADVLARSSNIGMAKIGERLTNARLYEAALAFGFGRPTGCGLPGELPGVVRPLPDWNAYSTGSVPMGHEIAVTPLQLVTAHAALAHQGKLQNPRLVLKIIDHAADPPGDVDRSSVPGLVVSHPLRPEVARWTVEGPMTDAVQRGTSRLARLENYTVFGKTGTSQKFDRSTGKYSTSRTICSFVGGAPPEDPRVLALVLVDEPTAGSNHTGGSVAAPAAAAILRQTLVHLRVPPSRPPTQAAAR